MGVFDRLRCFRQLRRSLVGRLGWWIRGSSRLRRSLSRQARPVAPLQQSAVNGRAGGDPGSGGSHLRQRSSKPHGSPSMGRWVVTASSPSPRNSDAIIQYGSSESLEAVLTISSASFCSSVSPDPVSAMMIAVGWWGPVSRDVIASNPLKF